jgi:hypothetical protein
LIEGQAQPKSLARPRRSETACAADPAGAYALVRGLLIARGIEDTHPAAGGAAQILAPWRADNGPPSWAALADEMEYNGVTPLLAPMLIAASHTEPESLPDAAKRMLVALVERHRRAAAAREACIDDLLTAFAAAKIPMLLLKGAALAHSIYSRPEFRAAADVDILVDPAAPLATTFRSSRRADLASSWPSRFIVTPCRLISRSG